MSETVVMDTNVQPKKRGRPRKLPENSQPKKRGQPPKHPDATGAEVALMMPPVASEAVEAIKETPTVPVAPETTEGTAVPAVFETAAAVAPVLSFAPGIPEPLEGLSETLSADLMEQDRRRNSLRLRGPKLTPSEISETCLRRLIMNRDERFLSAAEQVTSSDKDSILRFLSGNAFHEYLQSVVLKELDHCKVLAAEFPVEDELIRGRIDVVMEHVETGRPFLVEIKTVKSEKYLSVCNSGIPMREHVAQLTAYEGMTGLPGVLLYLDAERVLRSVSGDVPAAGGEWSTKSVIQVVEVPFDANLYANLRKRGMEFQAALAAMKADGTLPQVPEAYAKRPNGFPCMWCQHKHSCHPEAYKTIDLTQPGHGVSVETVRDFAGEMTSYEEASQEREAAELKLRSAEGRIRKLFYAAGNMSGIQGRRLEAIFDRVVRVRERPQAVREEESCCERDLLQVLETELNLNAFPVR